MSLVYDSEPLEKDVEILGFPRASLTAYADAPLAHWFVRLSDVSPDGSVSLITGAAQNGGHIRSAKEPEPLTPGKPYSFDVDMHFTSWVFPKGHRIRLSVGNAQWPMFWPTPYAMTTTLHLGGSEPTRLVLPVVPQELQEPRPVPSFREPAADPELPSYRSIATGTVSGYSELANVERDEQRGTARVVLENDSATEYPWGVVEYAERTTHTTNDRDPANTSVVGEYTVTVRLPDRALEFKGVLDFQSDRENFHLVYTRTLHRNGELIREKTWRETFPRDSQ
jgi:hypothetical protein